MARRLSKRELEWLIEREDSLRDLFGPRLVAESKFFLLRRMLIEPKDAYHRTIEKVKESKRYNWRPVVSAFMERLEKLGYIEVKTKEIVIRKNKEISLCEDEGREVEKDE